MKIINPATGAVIADVAADNAAAVRRKYDARPRRPARVGARADHASASRRSRTFRERDRRDARDARAHADARGRQADPPVAQRAERPPRRASTSSSPRPRARCATRRCSPTPRRSCEERITHEPLGVDRQHLGVELSVLRRQQRVRAGARRRQRRALQAVRVRDADRPAHRRDAARGGRARATCSCRSSATARPAPRCCAQPVDGVFFTGSYATGAKIAAAARPADDQGPARARRQGSRLRLRRRRRQGRRRRRRRRRVLQHRAVAAARSSASTCTSRSTTRSSPRSSPRCKGFRIGDPMDEATYIGAITRRPQLDVLKKQVADAKKKGAKLLAGGSAVTRQGQLVRADGVRRRRPLDGADARRELRPDHRHPGASPTTTRPST